MSFVFMIAATAVASDSPKPMNAPPPAPPAEVVAAAEMPMAYSPPALKPNRPATPRNRKSRWVTTADYPSRAVREGREGNTEIRLDVNRWGGVSDCTVTKSSGHADLDEKTCNSAAYKARFWPATDSESKPTKGSYITYVRWQIPKAVPAKADAAVASSYYPSFGTERFPQPPRMRGYSGWRFPEGDDYPAKAYAEKRGGETEVTLDITNDGNVKSCKVTKTSGHTDLDAVSCSYVTARARFDPARGVDGEYIDGRVNTGVAWVIPKAYPSDLVPPRQTYNRKPDKNMFRDTGSAHAEISFDKKGKLGACKIVANGQGALFEEISKFESQLCRTAGKGMPQIDPFMDAAGNPAERKVIIKVTLEHGEYEAASTDNTPSEK